MAQEVYVYPKRVVDSDDVVATASVAANSLATKLVWSKGASTSLYTRVGRRGRLVFFGNDVDAGGQTYITFHLKINGARISTLPLDNFTQSLGVTYDPQGRMSVPVDLPQGALVEVEVDNSNLTTSYNAFARMRIDYEDLA